MVTLFATTFTREHNLCSERRVGLFPAFGGSVGKCKDLLPADVLAHKMSISNNTVYKQLKMCPPH